jgi:hypothetical protein
MYPLENVIRHRVDVTARYCCGHVYGATV